MQSFHDTLPVDAILSENKDKNTVKDSQENKKTSSSQLFPQYNINIAVPQNVPLSQSTNLPTYSIPTQNQSSNQIFPPINVNIILPQIITQTPAPNVSFPTSQQAIQNQFPYQLAPQYNINIVLQQNTACNDH